jgi:uncharacterized membrane protein YfcA
MLPKELIGLVLFATLKALSILAGLGGGGIAVPIVMAFFMFETKAAVALSSFTILISTSASFVVNWNERHP